MTNFHAKTIAMDLADEHGTLELGHAIGQSLVPPGIVYLRGDLGAGKTTLSRGLLHGLGHSGSVKSPTYTIVEPYVLDAMSVYHFDLYRLGDPEELEYLGLRDYLEESALLLFEWPDRGGAYLPPADLLIELSPIDEGRHVELTASTPRGLGVLAHLRL